MGLTNSEINFLTLLQPKIVITLIEHQSNWDSKLSQIDTRGRLRMSYYPKGASGTALEMCRPINLYIHELMSKVLSLIR
jgi:hypothetical protein